MNGAQLPNFAVVYLEIRLSDWLGARMTGDSPNSAKAMHLAWTIKIN